MAVVWDEVYDPLDSAYLGYEPAFDKQGHQVVVHHHHHHQRPHSQSLTSGSNGITNQTSTTIIAAVPWTTPTDIHESKIAYHIDVDVPGVKDIDAFQIYWPTPRTLVVDAKAGSRCAVHTSSDGRGPAVCEYKPDADIAAPNAQTKSRSNGDGDSVLNSPDDIAGGTTTRVVLKERRLEPWRRSFTLPVDVDSNSAKAALEHGLLHISVLKKTKDTT